MNPEQGTFVLNSVFLPTVLKEKTTTAAVLAAIPDDRSDFRPEENTRSALDLAWHIVSAEMMFLDAVLNGQFRIPPAPKPEPVKTASDIAAWYGENFDARLARLRALPPEALVKIVDFRGFMQLPAVMYLDLSVRHSVHHRGQLSTYLRPMGSQVPAIYGESYDSKRAAAHKA